MFYYDLENKVREAVHSYGDIFIENFEMHNSRDLWEKKEDALALILSRVDYRVPIEEAAEAIFNEIVVYSLDQFPKEFVERDNQSVIEFIREIAFLCQFSNLNTDISMCDLIEQYYLGM